MPSSATARPRPFRVVPPVRALGAALAALALLLGLVAGAAGSTARAAEPSDDRVVVPMVFPVIGNVTWADTWGACRGTGCSRPHLGQDLMGRKMQELVAGFDGVVTYLRRDSSSGNYVSIRSTDRTWTLNYLHVNNDTPGTDDGRGSADHAFPRGLEVGSRVVRGQLVGWLGDSGNAEGTAPHLHIELRRGDAWSGTAVNLAPSLEEAQRLSAPVRGGTGSGTSTPTPSPSPSPSSSPSPSPTTSPSPTPTGTSAAPRGALDAVEATGRDTVRVAGWAYDADVAPDPVDVEVVVDDEVVATAAADAPRPDVARAVSGAGDSGFAVTVPVADGPHEVCVRVPDDGDRSPTDLGCREVEAGDRAPEGSLDLVEAVPGEGVRVRGWAFDPDDVDLPVDLRVTFDGVGAVALVADASRPDVDAAWGVGEEHGFDAVVPARPGRWEVCVTATGDGRVPLELGCRTVDLTTAGLNGLPRRVRSS